MEKTNESRAGGWLFCVVRGWCGLQKDLGYIYVASR